MLDIGTKTRVWGSYITLFFKTTGPSGLINTDRGQTVNKGKSSWGNVTNVEVETDLTAKKQQVQYILL